MNRFHRFAVAAVATLVVATAGRADDRDLLRSASGEPYVMVLFDTSGSMTLSPKCTQQDIDDGICTFLCPTGDCHTPRHGDDPAAKFHQAKEAMYEVIEGIEDVNFGLATYNQDELRAGNKHWLYQHDNSISENHVHLDSGFDWPQPESQEVFGQTWSCDRAGSSTTNNNTQGDLNEIGCYAAGNQAADTDDAWEMERVRRFPKLGNSTDTTREFWIRDGGQVYWAQYASESGSDVGEETLIVNVTIARCMGTPADNPSDNCNSNSERTIISGLQPKEITFVRIGDFLWHEPYATTRAAEERAFFAATKILNADDPGTSGPGCYGWDPNDDSGDDAYSSYSLRFPALGMLGYNPTGTANDSKFAYGDILPLDWTRKNRSEILDRLAPGRKLGGDPLADTTLFGQALYFEDTRRTAGSPDYLHLKDDTNDGDTVDVRPILDIGRTPLGYALGDVREWFRGCLNGSCPSDTGWDDIAAANDPNWGCRKKYLLVVTDGDDTCPGRDPCSFTASMHALADVLTYVVAFGVENTSGNKLNCMAANGGTGDPIYAQNKQQLVEALTNIFGEIREQAAAFASAAVPSVQANVSDKIYIATFNPVQERATWAGRLDAYLKPLPQDEAGFPDHTEGARCGNDDTSECWLWDAADSQPAWPGEADYQPRGLLEQAPLVDDIDLGDNTTYRLGLGADERRVYHARFGAPDDHPGNRRLLDSPAGASDQIDFWDGLGILPVGFDPDDSDEVAAVAGRADAILAETLAQKVDQITFTVKDPETGEDEEVEQNITYLMGDIFHSNPVVLNQPSNFIYYTTDPYLHESELCAAEQDPTRTPPVSYGWFADQHVCRRKLLFAGANDGQLHVFDAGIFDGSDCLLPAKDRDPRDAIEDLDNDGFADGDDDPIEGFFGNGTGREVFSFVPRAMLPRITQHAEGSDQVWSLDGTVRTDDVFIDPLASSAGSVTCLDREWRTVAIGGYREGGRGYFALDVTQPDLLDEANVPEAENGYVPSCADGAEGCGALPFPAVLWEFEDVQRIGSVDVPLDEDQNGLPELGNSWSRPASGKIRVCTGTCSNGEQEDRYVTVFGGGLGDEADDATGNALYIVDIESGKTLYKEVVQGSVAADVAAVDTNQNGYLDRIYFGTTAGFVYKVRLDNDRSTPLQIATYSGTTRISGVATAFSTERITGPVGDLSKYDPFQVFTTGDRPIYYEIGVIYVPHRNQYALSFGTGDRWDLWAPQSLDGRFYIIVDTDFVDANRNGLVDVSCGGCTSPLNESAYTAVLPDDVAPPDTGSLLDIADSTPGWYLDLLADERLITEAFSLSGVTIFSSYLPQQNVDADGKCSRTGESRIFVLATTDSNGLNIPEGGTLEDRTKYVAIPDFISQPYTEQSATKNKPGEDDGDNADELSAAMVQIRDLLQRNLFPSTCKFANYTLDIKTVRSDTGVTFIAPIPICIEPSNWKEF